LFAKKVKRKMKGPSPPKRSERREEASERRIEASERRPEWSDTQGRRDRQEERTRRTSTFEAARASGFECSKKRSRVELF
jgi:hypothetical protein